jgi:hypothetical protein
MAFSLHGLDTAGMKKKKPEQLFTTEHMLPISELRSDTVILKDGGMRAILRIEWINLDLKNSDEQMSVIERYKRFLNGLDFPLQIHVRNTYLDLMPYVNYMEKNVARIENDILKEQGENYVSFLQQINLAQGLLYVKEFYVIIPMYDAARSDEDLMKKSWLDKLIAAFEPKDSAEKIVARYRAFLRKKSELDSRCSIISEWLQALGMRVERMQTADIVALLFQEYNPSLHAGQSTMPG